MSDSFGVINETLIGDHSLSDQFECCMHNMGPFSLTSCTHGWHFEIHSLQMNEKKCYTTVVPFQEGRCMAFQFSFDAELIPKIVHFQSICVSCVTHE